MGELLQVRFHGHVATGHQLSKLVLVAREIFFVIICLRSKFQQATYCNRSRPKLWTINPHLAGFPRPDSLWQGPNVCRFNDKGPTVKAQRRRSNGKDLLTTAEGNGQMAKTLLQALAKWQNGSNRILGKLEYWLYQKGVNHRVIPFHQ